MLRYSESIEDNSMMDYYRMAKIKCEEKERNRHAAKFILAPHRRPDKASFHSPGVAPSGAKGLNWVNRA